MNKLLITLAIAAIPNMVQAQINYYHDGYLAAKYKLHNRIDKEKRAIKLMRRHIKKVKQMDRDYSKIARTKISYDNADIELYNIYNDLSKLGYETMPVDRPAFNNFNQTKIKLLNVGDEYGYRR